MNKILPKLAFLILMTAVFSVVTSNIAYASTNEGAAEEGPEGPSAAEEAAAQDQPEAAAPAVSTKDLPLCDGSAQDCVTEEGFFCEAGSYEDECECEEDMSDCPNHPRYDEIVRQNQDSDNE